MRSFQSLHTDLGSEVHDASDGADPGVPAPPLAEPLVLPGPDQVHPASVVRVLVEEPVAVGDVAGEDAVNVESVRDAGAVVHQVHHLPSELESLVQAQVERAGLLVRDGNHLINQSIRLYLYAMTLFRINCLLSFEFLKEGQR